jgi:two-component sensor histidine kinase/CHASE3 domain sensor protein
VLIGIPFFLLVTISCVVISRATIAVRWVMHSHSVIESLESIFTHLQGAETGQRGYLLTGEFRYLEPFSAALTNLDQEMTAFRNLVQDDPFQQKRMAELSQLISQEIDKLNKTILLRKKGGSSSIYQIVRTDFGKNVMDDIRRLIHDMEEEERALLKQRLQQVRQQSIELGVLFAGLFILLFVMEINLLRQIDRGRARERTLEASKRDLHQKNAFIQLLQQVSSSANEASGLSEAMQEALELICQHTRWAIGHGLVLAKEEDLLISSNWHTAPDQRFQKFKQAVDDLTFSRDVGLPGQVLASGTAIWISDLYKNTGFTRKQQAETAGLQSASAFPIVIGTEVVGVLEFFSEHTLEPDADLLQIMTQVGTILGRVAERQRTETLTAESLREKEVLLKEIHHRVKNNLQIISSFLRLQAGKIKGKEAAVVFQQSQDRIRAMALIHESLYGSKNISQIRFGPFVRNLVSYLLSSYGVSSSRVDTRIQIAEEPLDLDSAICCGLIITELVSNALKHAFPTDSQGLILIQFEKKDESHFQLVVSDNGVGLSPDLNVETLGSLGLRIIHALVDQLGGVLESDTQHGTSLRIIFPISLPARAAHPAVHAL